MKRIHNHNKCQQNKGNDDDDDESSKPRPRIFALLRYGHDVIRGGIDDIQVAVDGKEVDKAMNILYPQLHRWIRLYNLLQEGHPAPAESAPTGDRRNNSSDGEEQQRKEPPLGLFR